MKYTEVTGTELARKKNSKHMDTKMFVVYLVIIGCAYHILLLGMVISFVIGGK